MGWLLGNFLLASNSNFLAFKSSAVVLGSLSTTWQALDVPYTTVTLYLLQSFDSKSIEPPLHKTQSKNNLTVQSKVIFLSLKRQTIYYEHITKKKL